MTPIQPAQFFSNLKGDSRAVRLSLNPSWQYILNTEAPDVLLQMARVVQHAPKREDEEVALRDIWGRLLSPYISPVRDLQFFMVKTPASVLALPPCLEHCCASYFARQARQSSQNACRSQELQAT